MNKKAPVQDVGLWSKAKRKAKTKVIGSVTRVSVDAVDSMTKPLRKAATQKILQATTQMLGCGDEGELLSDSHAGTKLLMCANEKHKGWFVIYGLGYNVRYQVKTERISKNTIIMDPEGKKLVLIKKKLFAFRFPWSMQIDPIDFNVQIAGRAEGTVKTHYKGTKRVIKTTMNDWTIAGNFWGTKYQVVSGDALIASITETTERSEKHYVVNCGNPDDLLMVLALMVISQKTK